MTFSTLITRDAFFITLDFDKIKTRSQKLHEKEALWFEIGKLD